MGKSHPRQSTMRIKGIRLFTMLLVLGYGLRFSNGAESGAEIGAEIGADNQQSRNFFDLTTVDDQEVGHLLRLHNCFSCKLIN